MPLVRFTRDWDHKTARDRTVAYKKDREYDLSKTAHEEAKKAGVVESVRKGKEEE